MKFLLTILIIILLIPITGQSQTAWESDWLKGDKIGHIVYSTGLTVVGIQLAKKLNMRNPELAGAALSLTVGMMKEFLMDARPSPYDIAANAIGIGFAIPLNRFMEKIHWKRNKNKI